ncbi:MAG: rRNA maturation RNase YbeY [Candidatus Xenobia bacterium]
MPRARILFRTETRGGSIWRGLVSRMVRHTLAVANFQQPCEVSVLVTGDEAIRDLNREYRNLDATTDVLSFSMLEEPPQAEDPAYGQALRAHPGTPGGLPAPTFWPENTEPPGRPGRFLGSETTLLGDLVISVETATRRAAGHGVPLEAEMALLVAHGVLHLLGYDHQAPGPRQRMRKKEAEALQRCGIDPMLVGRRT